MAEIKNFESEDFCFVSAIEQKDKVKQPGKIMSECSGTNAGNVCEDRRQK